MPIYAIDTETYKQNTATGIYEPTLNARNFTLGAVLTEKLGLHYFNHHNLMLRYILEQINQNEQNNKKSYFYAHNMEYDFISIFKDNLLDEKINYICFNPFIAIYNQKHYFLDTMSFYRMSLETMGQTIKLPKLEMPKEITTKEQLKPYLKRDVEIVLKGIKNIKEEINKLGFKPRKLLTAGQLAINIFLTHCKREKIHHTFMEYNPERKIYQVTKTKYPKRIRKAFRGGMNKCYQIGKFKNVTLIDANGLYAFIMKEMDFPDLKTEMITEKPSVGMLKAYYMEEIGIAECTIIAPKIELPYLPIRYRNYTIYPQNRIMKGTWTFLELKKAVELGYEIQSCGWCIRWKKSETNPFTKFIKELYEIEKSKKTTLEKLPIKLIRNNLYGKFSQYKRNKDYKRVLRQEIHLWTEKGYTPISISDDHYIMMKEMEEYDPSYTNPIISTMITANARLYLYENLTKIKREDLLYCDTDSIAFKGNYIEKFHLGIELGQWKIETSGTGKFLGEKRYYINEQAKISGLPKKQQTREIIEKEQPITTKKMIGLKMGIKQRNLKRIGTFLEQTQEMQPHNKEMLFIPTMIDET